MMASDDPMVAVPVWERGREGRGARRERWGTIKNNRGRPTAFFSFFSVLQLTAHALRVGQVRQLAHAVRVDLGGAGVLLLVDGVHVEGLRHQLQALFFNARRDKSGQVKARVAVKQTLVAD
jgi:hypothetical protein